MEAMTAENLLRELRDFRWEGCATVEGTTRVEAEAGHTVEVPTFTNEFWTAKQRDAHSMHEISYRACFKPQLPRFFIERLTVPGDVVYDPFSGRGTTPLEAAIAGRVPYANDISPLTAILLEPRLSPPAFDAVRDRLSTIDLDHAPAPPDDLLTFYHPHTLREICALREYLLVREGKKTMDAVDRWIRMVSVNRLTGHSPGFFSVYTLPPNQATSVSAQRKINVARKQTPPRRDVRGIILKKSRALLKDHSARDGSLFAAELNLVRDARIVTGAARHTPGIPTASVALVITSPPFLNIVNYKYDNWLRCWFCGIDPDLVRLTVPGSLKNWQREMTSVFHELHRVLKPGGFVAFEVGEVRKGTVRLEETVIPCGLDAGLKPVLVLLNAQEFTKTANVWGISNNRLGTNTNRIVVFQKP
jgi:hypothetical protein